MIAYNASVPTKFMPSPYAQGYVAHKKYATVADLLGLGGHSTEEKVSNLIISRNFCNRASSSCDSRLESNPPMTRGQP